MEYDLPKCTCYVSDPYDCPRGQARVKLERELRELGLVEVGSGCSRIAYKHPFSDWVIKVPLNCRYMLANVCEYRVAKAGNIPAPEVLLEWIHGVPVIHMEMITPAPYGSARDEWHDEMQYKGKQRLFDGCQIGRHKDGRVLAYDLGHEESGWQAFEKDKDIVRKEY